ncbi:hypothetical protein C9J01_06295 [Photobacterium rosenbergii]|uniref:Uncharacterized protein n=1 Tax=Photobacterium rosenbergii TaxID=294936 RepID=A0A2T3NM72_9GAMM|nr:hypothetical protein [Photobacterium rosenbergii]PSW16601.1 hypothetical protein C9J01_06295 [Photobacterium rosenbergii]
MNMAKKLSFIVVFLAFTYVMAWVKAYNQSSEYFEYARQQRDNGNLTYALKGMNKLELRIEEKYLGGYQQVIETWESSILGPRPGFYDQAVKEAEEIIPQLSEQELESFIEIYVQLDTRYVPEAAQELLKKSKLTGNTIMANEMSEFLDEAFPEQA